MEKKIDSLPLTSTHWGTYRAKVTNGRVQELYGFEYDNDPSPIGSGIIDVQDGPTRISKPSIRKSWLENGTNSHNHLSGVDPFVEVTWSEAEKIVANELKRVSNIFGNSAIFAGAKLYNITTSAPLGCICKTASSCSRVSTSTSIFTR